MKYILLVENDDGLPVGKICKDLQELENETCKAIYEIGLIDLDPDQQEAIMEELDVLKDEGALHFEGDPSIRWAILAEEII